jgi:hypothetical protein
MDQGPLRSARDAAKSAGRACRRAAAAFAEAERDLDPDVIGAYTVRVDDAEGLEGLLGFLQEATAAGHVVELAAEITVVAREGHGQGEPK